MSLTFTGGAPAGDFKQLKAGMYAAKLFKIEETTTQWMDEPEKPQIKWSFQVIQGITGGAVLDVEGAEQEVCSRFLSMWSSPVPITRKGLTKTGNVLKACGFDVTDPKTVVKEDELLGKIVFVQVDEKMKDGKHDGSYNKVMGVMPFEGDLAAAQKKADAAKEAYDAKQESKEGAFSETLDDVIADLEGKKKA